MLTTINKQLQEYTVCRFGGPKAPPVVKPPLASQAAGTINATDALRPRPKGSGSTILTGGEGVTNQTSKKTILGG